MIVYVESNFVLELAFLQEESEDCSEILQLAEAQRIELVFPSFCVGEPYETLVRRSKDRDALQTRLSRELADIGRSKQYQETVEGSSEVIGLLGRSADESETIRFERIPVVRHEGADPVQIRAFQFKGEQFYQNINRASQLAKYLLPPNSTGSSREGTPDVNEFSTLIWDLRIEFNDLMGYRRTAQYEVRADYGMARVRVFPAKQI